MTENRVDEAAHPLRPPHLEMPPADRAEFAPLKFRVQPGNVSVEITRREAVLGRHSQADVRLAFAEVSRRHCRVSFEDGRWRVVDLHSLNGVFVNGERMHDAVLYQGDRVRIGTCVIVVDQATPVQIVLPTPAGDAEIRMLHNIVASLPR